MSYFKFWWSLPIALLVTQALQAQSTPYATVTDERLQHPEAGDWLMYRRTYDGSGFSPLKQITAANIGRLSLAWSVNTDLVEAHETAPIVNHGRMFVTTPQNNVIALNAKTGVELWRYAKKYPEGLFQLHLQDFRVEDRSISAVGDHLTWSLAEPKTTSLTLPSSCWQVCGP